MNRKRLSEASNDGNVSGPREPLRPGDQFTFTRKNDDGSVAMTVTIERTARPYAFDLCDAYNKTMLPAARANGCEYFVDGQGQVRLGFPEQFSKDRTKQLERTTESERRDFNHRSRYPVA